MTDIHIYDYFYTCIHCKAEISVTSSNPAGFNDTLFCFKCGQIQLIKGLKNEPEIETIKIEKERI
jgi:transcription elongation factor Elf1